VPSALLIAAAKSQLGPLGGVAASLAALSAWWPAPAALVLIAVGSSGYLAVRERLAALSAAGAAEVAVHSSVAPSPRAPDLHSAPAVPAALVPPSLPSQAPVLDAEASARLGKLRQLGSGGYEKLIEHLILSKATPAEVAATFEARLGLTITEEEARELMVSPKLLYLGPLEKLGERHPRETLAWLAAEMTPGDARHSAALVDRILARQPELDHAALSALLPAGPGADAILGMLRFRVDPATEATRRLTAESDPKTRRKALEDLGQIWPAGREIEAFDWAGRNLQGREREGFLSGVAYELSHRDPDTTLVLLEGLRGTATLAPVLQRAMRGLIQENGKIAEVLPLVETLGGEARAATLAQLADRWVRVDQEGLIDWLARRENPADLHAALPASLLQLNAENRSLVLDKLLASEDPGTEATLIRSATPPLYGVTRDASALIERLASRPGLTELSAGSKDNGQLLWRAVETTARNWVSRDGGAPKDAAAWVDRLRFATTADKTRIARIVYDQWKASDAAAATEWARATDLLPATP
jgi:hypothetical protein